MFRQRHLGQGLGDVFFLAVAGVLLAVGLVFANWGEFRAFVLLGLATGLMLYFSLASAVVTRLLAVVLGAVFAWLGWLARLVGAAGRVSRAFLTRHRQRWERSVVRPARRIYRWVAFQASRMARWWRKLPGFL